MGESFWKPKKKPKKKKPQKTKGPWKPDRPYGNVRERKNWLKGALEDLEVR